MGMRITVAKIWLARSRAGQLLQRLRSRPGPQPQTAMPAAFRTMFAQLEGWQYRRRQINPGSYIREVWTIIEAEQKITDQLLIARAFCLAWQAHQGHMRYDNKSPFMIHPLAVAKRAQELGLGAEAIAAALCHDVIEDTAVNEADIKRELGANVALIVDGLTGLQKMSFASEGEKISANLQKWLWLGQQELAVIILKFPDQEHNMATIKHMHERTRKIKAVQCLGIYAPFARLTGFPEIATFLEETSLALLPADNPMRNYEHRDLVSFRERNPDDWQTDLSNFLSTLRFALDQIKLESPYDLFAFISQQIKAI